MTGSKIVLQQQLRQALQDEGMEPDEYEFNIKSQVSDPDLLLKAMQELKQDLNDEQKKSADRQEKVIQELSNKQEKVMQELIEKQNEASERQDKVIQELITTQVRVFEEINEQFDQRINAVQDELNQFK